MSWWTDDESDVHYLGPVLLCVIALILIVIGQVVTTRISADILENCNPQELKESAKSIWTNIGVTAALMLTLVMAMLQVDPISPSGFTYFEDKPDVLVDVQQSYITAVVLSLLGNLVSMLLCVVNISYADPLTPVDAIKFFLERPDTLGDPITVLIAASLMMFVAVVLWVLGTYGLTQALVTSICGLVAWICLACQWVVNGSFSPSARGPETYKWTQEDPSTWPKNRAESGSKMSSLSGSRQVRVLVQKLGRVILDESKSESHTNC